MPDTRISALSASTARNSGDRFPVVQTAGVGPVTHTLAQIATFTLGGSGGVSGGNVGIGTASPSYTLDVRGTVAGIISSELSFRALNTSTFFYLNIGSTGFDAYTNTNAAAPIIFKAGSGETMRITSAGNVGIGTASPNPLGFGNVLTVSDGGSPAFSLMIGGASIFDAVATTTASYITTRTATPLVFQTNATERMRITSAGNVGIGTTSAWSGLRGLQNGNASLSAASFDGYLSANVFFDGTGWKYINSAFGIQYFQDATTDGAHVWRTAASGSAGAAATLTERMRITSAGLVGIGTSSPSYLLDVSGAGVQTIRIRNTTTNTDAYLLAQNTSGTALFGINANGPYIYTADAAAITFSTNTAERMRITSAGNIHTPAGSTGMTNGFFYMPAAAGAPSGTPTSIGGTVPFYYDTTNNQFYVYNGAWKKVTLA